MSTPILSIAIPAYNAADFLKETVKTFLDYTKSELEVLIIDDGSTDDTGKIAEELAKTSPLIKSISQKNGGPGSAINTAIKNATGKYFRILDSDDWFDDALFKKFLEKLKKETADLILTEHKEIFLKRHEETLSHDYDNIEPNILLNLSNLKFKKYGPTLPNTTIKTTILKKSGFLLDEHCFYIDQEYNFINYVLSKTVIKYDLPVYNYRLEQDNQSMAKKNLAKNVLSHETVCIRLIKELDSYNLPESKKTQLLENIIVPLCNLQYEITLDFCHSKKAFLSFDNKLKKHPYLYNHPGVAGTIVNLHRKTKGKTIFLNKTLKKVGDLKHSK